jgi:hypothetical protein
MYFIYFWIPSKDDGLELRHSLRSLEQNFVGEFDVTIIGDKPQWYTGRHIHRRRVISAPGNLHAYRDTQAKLMEAIANSQIPDEFCWIADDNFLLRPVDAEHLRVARYDPYYVAPSVGSITSGWKGLIKRTMKALADQGYPQKQFATHLPQVVEKSALSLVLKQFDYPKNLYLWEVLYGNCRHADPQSYQGFLLRIQQRMTKYAMMQEMTQKGFSVLNYTANVYNQSLVHCLTTLFPEASRFEKGS